MDSIFKFKQFEVDQSGCAMKINTDGVLLAALAESDEPTTILDIGTGTGVIALMLAQRFKNAKIEAVEIDGIAAATAEKNFRSSVFGSRLTAVHSSIQQYKPLTTQMYDLIISNPPYFVNDLKNAEEKKGIARHTDEAFFDELISKVSTLLSENGSFWFILPLNQADLLINKAAMFNLHLLKQISLYSDATKPAFRKIVCLTRKEVVSPKTQDFYIYESEKVYTKAYKELLSDFFLNL